MFYYKTVWCPFNLTSHDKVNIFHSYLSRVSVFMPIIGKIFEENPIFMVIRLLHVPIGSLNNLFRSILKGVQNHLIVNDAMDGK